MDHLCQAVPKHSHGLLPGQLHGRPRVVGRDVVRGRAPRLRGLRGLRGAVLEAGAMKVWCRAAGRGAERAARGRAGRHHADAAGPRRAAVRHTRVGARGGRRSGRAARLARGGGHRGAPEGGARFRAGAALRRAGGLQRRRRTLQVQERDDDSAVVYYVALRLDPLLARPGDLHSKARHQAANVIARKMTFVNMRSHVVAASAFASLLRMPAH